MIQTLKTLATKTDGLTSYELIRSEEKNLYLVITILAPHLGADYADTIILPASSTDIEAEINKLKTTNE